jgi:antibiotic biosynthesis monooxygenase (ABM) superfamily enzyme
MEETSAAGEAPVTITESTDAVDDPETIILRRKAQPGQEKSFEIWLEGASREAQKFEAHQGVTIIRPTAPANPEYVVRFRFNTCQNLRKLRLAITVVIIGLLMSYLVMPLMTRLVARWLLPRPRQPQSGVPPAGQLSS